MQRQQRGHGHAVAMWPACGHTAAARPGRGHGRPSRPWGGMAGGDHARPDGGGTARSTGGARPCGGDSQARSAGGARPCVGEVQMWSTAVLRGGVAAMHRCDVISAVSPVPLFIFVFLFFRFLLSFHSSFLLYPTMARRHLGQAARLVLRPEVARGDAVQRLCGRCATAPCGDAASDGERRRRAGRDGSGGHAARGHGFECGCG